MSSEQSTEEDDLHKVGPYLLRKVKPGPTSAGIDPTYALCMPDRWGMRYSDKDPKRSGQLMYPVARDYAKAMQTVLLNQVQWGNAYFGPAGAKPTLQLRWPISKDQETQLYNLFEPIMSAALKDNQGGFGIPASAVPAIVSYRPQNAMEQGAFSPSNWQMKLNISALSGLFKLPQAANAGSVDRNQQIEPISQFADTIYHESRHCQQYFWIFSLIFQHTDNFEGIPNIAKYPKLVNDSATDPSPQASKILGLAAKQPLPEDVAALISLKRMAVGIYYQAIVYWKRIGYWPPYLSDMAAFDADIQKVRKAAVDLLQHVGIGGTPIDVDAMVAEPPACYCDYSERPWENDAFFCGDMATAYWREGLGFLLKTYPADQCSHAYEVGNDERIRSKSGTGSANGTSGGK